MLSPTASVVGVKASTITDHYIVELFCITHPCVSDNTRQTCCFKGHFPTRSVTLLSQVLAHSCGKRWKKHLISATPPHVHQFHRGTPIFQVKAQTCSYGTVTVPKKSLLSRLAQQGYLICTHHATTARRQISTD